MNRRTRLGWLDSSWMSLTVWLSRTYPTSLPILIRIARLTGLPRPGVARLNRS
jgi:hypothetical protein